MCLNASLAGLVAITAPCDVTDALGAAIIGAVAGVLVVFGVWLCDHVLRVDDPVGAVAVHMMNGIWGTFAVGLFATSSAPGFKIAGIKEGLFYGGGFNQLGLQILGILYGWCMGCCIDYTYISCNSCNHWSSCKTGRRNRRSGCNRAWFAKCLCRLYAGW